MLYKYLKDKMNVRDTIRAVNNSYGCIVTDTKDICYIFSVWFHSVFKNEDAINQPEDEANEINNFPVCPNITINISDRLKIVNSFRFLYVFSPENRYLLAQCLYCGRMPT